MNFRLWRYTVQLHSFIKLGKGPLLVEHKKSLLIAFQFPLLILYRTFFFLLTEPKCTTLCVKSPVDQTISPFGVCLNRYSAEKNTISHECQCCHEKRTSKKQVELTCNDGSKIIHSHTMVEECHCVLSNCEIKSTSEPSRRRRR